MEEMVATTECQSRHRNNINTKTIHALVTEETISIKGKVATSEMTGTEMAEVDVIRLHEIEVETILRVEAEAIDKEMEDHVEAEETEVTTEAIIEGD